ncbi:MAG TPA: hypothetical protein VGQ19_08915 [Burkholderiales bacterium]|nr:hypothetical protein [Burkholderiales bacterium]
MTGAAVVGAVAGAATGEVATGAAGARTAGAAVVGAVAGAATGEVATGAAGAAIGAVRDAFGERSSTGAAVGMDAQATPSAATIAASMSGRDIPSQRKTTFKSIPP